jgi:NAD+ synthase
VPPLDTELAEKVLVQFLREEAARAGFHRLVIGLSGGIDSAVSALLAVRAVGAQNFIALALPWKGSSPESYEHAVLVAEAGGFDVEQVDLTASAEGLLAVIPEPDNLRIGNVLARLRMVALWDRSHKERALVVGTSNKTELLLGYSTMHGDMAAALNPLGDLYKCQIRELARHLGVPDVVTRKPPSADLWADQTDEGELGFSYDAADAVLWRLVDHRESPEALIAQGFDEELVETLVRRMRQSQFKRRGPLIAKLSNRTISWEFRYPRDWGT